RRRPGRGGHARARVHGVPLGRLGRRHRRRHRLPPADLPPGPRVHQRLRGLTQTWMESLLDRQYVSSYLVTVKRTFHPRRCPVHQRLTTILRRVLEVALALLLAFTGIALARGQLSAPALS